MGKSITTQRNGMTFLKAFTLNLFFNYIYLLQLFFAAVKMRKLLSFCSEKFNTISIFKA